MNKGDNDPQNNNSFVKTDKINRHSHMSFDTNFPNMIFVPTTFKLTI